MILDTNGLFALAEGELRLEPILRKAAQIAAPVIVLGEDRYGIQQTRERQRYEHWLVEYLPKFRVLNVDEQTTTSYADVRGELNPIPSNDVWIAALCRQHSLPVLSRDRHFDLVPGLRRIDW